MKTYTLADPTPELVKAMAAASGTASYRGVAVARIPFNTATSNAAINWINPETGTVLARAYVVFTTGGTGTFDLGVSDDGTGTNAGIIDGGTMTVGAHYPQEVVGTVAASATAGGEDLASTLIGPGGTGTNNSIIMVHTDTTTGSAAGALLVEYFLIG